ncbi:MAG: uridine kinase [Caulobacterales bacterium]
MAYLIGIAGGSASGKTTIAHALAAELAPRSVALIAEDDYYLDRSAYPDFDPDKVNFDAPSAKDDVLLREHLAAARRSQPFDKPLYDLKTHARLAESERLRPADVVIVEGIHVLSSDALCACFDLKVYIDAEETLRLGRRMIRDVTERNRTPHSVLQQFFLNVRPMHDLHVAPQARRADLVLQSSFAGGAAEAKTQAAQIAAQCAFPR